jgi:hypothetical protein
MEPRSPEAQRRLTEDFEWKQSIKTFTASSDRVRYIMFGIVIATFIAMFGWDNAREDSWMGERAENASVALRDQLWTKLNCSALIDREQRKACHWLHIKALGPETEANRLSPIERARRLNAFATTSLPSLVTMYRTLEIEHGYYMHVPFVDVTFDVNDLGFVTGLSFAFIMLVLFLSMAREHENLDLCLTRVVEKYNEAPDGAGRSRANLFYHSLAMAQVFANPPTTARWKRSLIDSVPSVIYCLPLLPQALIFWNDTRTLPTALTLNRDATLISWSGQGLCLLFVLAMSLGCLLYGRSSDKKWERCFKIINPEIAEREQSSLVDWLELRRKPVAAHARRSSRRSRSRHTSTPDPSPPGK